MRFFCFALTVLATLFPATAGENEVRVLVVGDSWADLMWTNRSLRGIFALEGHGDIVEKGDVTAISGSTAEEWSDPAMLQLITDELATNPTIDLVQLTIGGNDFLAGQSGGGWFTGMTLEQEEAFFLRVSADILTVIDHILAFNPDLEIVLSFYDYPNFVETLNGLLSFFCTPLWEDLGEPLPEEINLALLDFSDRILAMTTPMSRVSQVDHAGLMQFHFGYPSMGIMPGDLPPPGDATLPSPPQSLNFGGNDCFHLNATGYEILAQNLYDQFYVDVFCLTPDRFRQDLPMWPGASDILTMVIRSDRLCEPLVR